MKNPLLKVDVNLIPDQGTYIGNWFNPSTVENQQLLITEIEVGDLRQRIIAAHQNWDAPAKYLAEDPLNIDSDYKNLPAYSHTSNKVLQYALNDTTVHSDDETATVTKQFIYAIMDDVTKQNNMKPIGYIAGTFTISGKDTLSTNFKENDLQIDCFIKAIELDPEYRGLELGTYVSHKIVQNCEDFLNGTLSQLSKNSLSKVTFKPSIESDMYSKSGQHWFNHLASLYNMQINELLLSYAPAKRVSATEIVPSI